MKPVDGIMDNKTKVMAYGGVYYAEDWKEVESTWNEYFGLQSKRLNKLLDEKH